VDPGRRRKDLRKPGPIWAEATRNQENFAHVELQRASELTNPFTTPAEPGGTMRKHEREAFQLQRCSLESNRLAKERR